MTTLQQFCKNTKASRFPRYVQFTGQFSRQKKVGCDYYVYVCIDTLEVINPFTKKHQGRKYKTFWSSVSADDAKEQAYNYILIFSQPLNP